MCDHFSSFSLSCKTCFNKKAKCDRKQPLCGRCTNLGLPCTYDPKKVPACNNCSKLRKKCQKDSQNNCQRCKSKGLKCEYPDPEVYRKKRKNSASNELHPESTSQPAVCSSIGDQKFMSDDKVELSENKKKAVLLSSASDEVILLHSSELKSEASGLGNLERLKENELSSAGSEIVNFASNKLVTVAGALGTLGTWEEMEPSEVAFCDQETSHFFVLPPRISKLLYQKSADDTEMHNGERHSLDFFSLPRTVQIPSESQIFKANDSIFLSIYMNRFSPDHSFLVDVNIFERGLAVCATSPSAASLLKFKGGPSQEFSKKSALQASLVAALAMGAFLGNYFEALFYQDCCQLFRQSIQQAIVDEKHEPEIIFAYAMVAFCYFVINNIPEFQKHTELFQVAMHKSRAPDSTSARLQKFCSYLTMISACYDTKKCDQIKICIWHKILSIIDSMGYNQQTSFTHLSTVVEDSLLAGFRDKHMLNLPMGECTEDFCAISNKFLISVISLHVWEWMKQVILDPFILEQEKFYHLDDVVRFQNAVLHQYQQSFEELFPLATSVLEITKAFLQVVTGEKESAQNVLLKLCVKIYSNNYLLHWCLSFPCGVHLLHLLAMTLSSLEMFDDYEILQKKANLSAEIFNTPAFPTKPPTKDVGICNDPKCMKSWNALNSSEPPSFVMQRCVETFLLLNI